MSDGITQVPPQATSASCQTVPFLTRGNLDDLIMIVLAEKTPAHFLIGNMACVDLYNKLNALRDAIVDPVYEHDCKKCEFLGVFSSEVEGHYDLYFCPNEPTVIARYGSDGPEYASGLTAARAGSHPALKRALELAKQHGHLEGLDERA